MKKQEVSPSGLSKASSPRSPVWSQVSVCLFVYCTWLHALALQFVVRFFLKYGLVSLGATIILCLCVLMSHQARGQVRISKANMTFWAHLNCCYYSWRHMMSLPIRPQPLRKLPVVWHCHSGKNVLFILSFPPPSLCVHALYTFMCLHMKWVTHVGWWWWWWGSKGCFQSHSFMWHPHQPNGLTISLSSLCQAHRPGQTLCSPGAEREKGLQNLFTIVLYLAPYSAVTALTRSSEHERVAKASSMLICVAVF